jgi:hypothetical protein
VLAPLAKLVPSYVYGAFVLRSTVKLAFAPLTVGPTPLHCPSATAGSVYAPNVPSPAFQRTVPGAELEFGAGVAVGFTVGAGDGDGCLRLESAEAVSIAAGVAPADALDTTACACGCAGVGGGDPACPEHAVPSAAQRNSATFARRFKCVESSYGVPTLGRAKDKQVPNAAATAHEESQRITRKGCAAIMGLGDIRSLVPIPRLRMRPMAQQSRLGIRSFGLRIDSRSSVPKPRQIYAVLREAILDGKLKPSDVSRHKKNPTEVGF